MKKVIFLGILVSVEYCGLWTLLCSSDLGICIRRKLVCCSYMAAYHCSRYFTDSPLRKTDSFKEPGLLRHYPGWCVLITDIPLSYNADHRNTDCSGTHPHRSLFLSSWQPQDDGMLSARIFHIPAGVRHGDQQFRSFQLNKKQPLSMIGAC